MRLIKRVLIIIIKAVRMTITKRILIVLEYKECNKNRYYRLH